MRLLNKKQWISWNNVNISLIVMTLDLCHWYNTEENRKDFRAAKNVYKVYMLKCFHLFIRGSSQAWLREIIPSYFILRINAVWGILADDNSKWLHRLVGMLLEVSSLTATRSNWAIKPWQLPYSSISLPLPCSIPWHAKHWGQLVFLYKLIFIPSSQGQ